jgi:hypothetical protein
LAAKRFWFIMRLAAKAPRRCRPVSSTLGITSMFQQYFALSALVISSLASPASAQTTSDFSLRQNLASSRSIQDVIARSSKIPLRKRYDEMSLEEKENIRGLYTKMEPDDEPPFPERGLAPLIRAIHRAQLKLRVEGDLYLVADVDQKGEVISVSAYGSPSTEMTNFAASAIAFEKFKPALCKGSPCPQKYPLALKFQLE